MSDDEKLQWQDVAAAAVPQLPARLAGRVEALAAQGRLSADGSIFLAGQSVREELERYFGEERHLERLALLLGRVWRMKNRSGFVACVSGYRCSVAAESSPVHVRMAAVDWPRVWTGMEARQLIGWAHSHPGHGVRPSPIDRATQRRWFTHPWALALIFDPCAGTRAAYGGPACEPVTVQEDSELTALLS